MKTRHILFLLACMALFSCKKYLDASPNKQLVIPTSVDDLQGIIDNNGTMNRSCAEQSETAADNYYLTDATFSALAVDAYRNSYLWKAGIFIGLPTNATAWVYEYNVVYNANVVLDNLPNIERNATNAVAWDNCKGSALLFRAKSFYEIAQIWAKAYDPSTAGTDLGIPLRKSSDFNIPTTRSSVQDTYNQIIFDITQSIPLLPTLATTSFRPSKAAAYGLLAKTYLATRDYVKAGLYADSCLQINHNLQDFNSVSATATFPFSALRLTNPEHIFFSSCLTTAPISNTNAKIDTLLFASYAANDLRKTVYFKKNTDNSYAFKGSYFGSNVKYSGIETDEMYLTRAECFARQGVTTSAMSDLNTLLIKRYKNGTFVPYTATSATDALNQILSERRKELIMRMVRFSDIKRLNKEGANIQLKRVIQGQPYILPPNDPRYALPIPDEVIQYSGIQQNPGY